MKQTVQPAREDTILRRKVTIGIPTYNRANLLRVALQSALAQTYPNLEIVVSNNACKDDTAEVLASIDDPHLRVITHPATVSMVENWNTCVRAATGEYFLLLNDDDVLEATAIEEMVEVFEQSRKQGKEIAFVWCRATIIDGDGKILSVDEDRPPAESAKDLILMYFEGRHNLHLYPSATLHRTASLCEGYDPHFSLGVDTVLWIKTVILYGTAINLDRRLMRYRVHQNTTLTTPIDAWCKANSAIAEYAIAALREDGRSDWDYENGIRKLEYRNNVRLTIGLIRHALRDKKLRALYQYGRNYRTFCSFFGLKLLLKGILILMMPRTLETWLRRRMAASSD